MEDKLKLFGRPKLLSAAGQQINIPPSIWRVIAIIAAQPHGLTDRVFLAETTWGVQKLSTLRKFIWDIRQIEAASAIKIIDIDAKSIRLIDTVYSDVQDLLSERPRESLSQIYRGPYVDGLISTVPAWTAWIAGERKRLHGIYVAKAHAALADPTMQRGELVREARHLLQVDPSAEVAMRAEMVVDAIQGDSIRVRRGYHALETYLHENGQRPSDQTRNLYNRLVGSAGVKSTPRGQDPDVPSICILPPNNPVCTPDAHRLARSLIVDVTVGLCRHSLLKVIAPHTAAQIRNADEVVTLGVSYVVTVELLDHVVGPNQVVCSLLALPARRVLWSDRIEIANRYSVDTYNLLTSSVLRSVLHHVDQATIEAYALRAEPSSYVDFLRGQAALTSLDLRDIRRGRQHLRRAVDRSPTFAPAISALARSYQLEWLLTARGDGELLVRSSHYARAAVSADPYEARGHRELGFFLLYSKRFDASIEQYQIAERLNPHYADVIAEYADALIHDGQPSAALEKIDLAIELNPLCQDTYYWAKGSAHFFLEEYQDAVDALMRMKDHGPVHRLLAAVYALSGNSEQASRCRTKAMELHPEMDLERWVNIVPFRDPRHVQHYRKGLQLAGFQ